MLSQLFLLLNTNKTQIDMKTRYLLITIAGMLSAIVSPTLQGQEKDNILNASITQDVTSNMSGGAQTGETQLGLINLDFAMNTENMNLWEGGTFKIHIQNTYGGRPTEKLVGDLQVYNNIENGNHTYLYQLWYQQRIGDLSLLLGKHDMNARFFTSGMAGSYINSSFGIMPLASLNVPVSIFPNTTLGLTGKYTINPNMAVQAGIYNGIPGEITQSNFGTDLNLGLNHGFFYIGEFHLKNPFESVKGTYKVGAFHHSGDFSIPTKNSRQQPGAGGVYFMADQMITATGKNGRKGLGTFLQLGYSPDVSSINDFYWALGMNYTGLLHSGGKDEVGLALAHASAQDRLAEAREKELRSCETVVEFTYRYAITDQITLQPDIQYIIHPGMNPSLENAWAGTFRIHWNYQ